MKELLTAIILFIPSASGAELTFGQIMQLEAARLQVAAIRTGPQIASQPDSFRAKIDQIDNLLEEIATPDADACTEGS